MRGTGSTCKLHDNFFQSLVLNIALIEHQYVLLAHSELAFNHFDDLLHVLRTRGQYDPVLFASVTFPTLIIILQRNPIERFQIADLLRRDIR